MLKCAWCDYECRTYDLLKVHAGKFHEGRLVEEAERRDRVETEKRRKVAARINSNFGPDWAEPGCRQCRGVGFVHPLVEGVVNYSQAVTCNACLPNWRARRGY